ncbi:hypothetical protein PR202_ga03836 [Eleusine coracana subsp. coracana]|uniref:O-methyltransferase dimerisation domain-containing protein n=1 Tax=Eleusine coracana subsp. coracana TaxID=191504 RepID=A0AAV5BPI1_ELECO|nr:hypothetical protein PR202_ga03836 [Eleusine coracana subsp. coracana]
MDWTLMNSNPACHHQRSRAPARPGRAVAPRVRLPEIHGAAQRDQARDPQRAELHAALPNIAPSKRPCLSRLMRFLSAMGIFREEEDLQIAGDQDRRRYRLTAASRLLVNDDGLLCRAVLFHGVSSPA